MLSAVYLCACSIHDGLNLMDTDVCWSRLDARKCQTCIQQVNYNLLLSRYPATRAFAAAMISASHFTKHDSAFEACWIGAGAHNQMRQIANLSL